MIVDPFKLIQLVWPDVRLYDKQAEIIESVEKNKETIVIAGNQLGKDYIAALLSLTFFCSRRPARVVTSSVNFEQLNDVLWGELRDFLDQAEVNLPIQYNHMRIRQVNDYGEFVPKCELIGQVVKQGEAMLGRHLPRGPNGQPRTLFIADECSGFPDEVWDKASTWAHSKLAIGNPYECENFFRRAYEEGSVLRDDDDPSRGYIRKVIYICAEDSPNVKYARKEIAEGKKPSNRIVIPGVKDWNTYQEQRKDWDIIKQTVSLDAKFYEGSTVKLYPSNWLSLAEARGATTYLSGTEKAEAIGVDPAEGGDSSVWTVISKNGIIEQISKKTPDTNDIPNFTLHLINKYKLAPENVMFDRGGGGKQHADALRAKGYPVNTIGFGEAASDPEKRKKTRRGRIKEEENRVIYKNRRAEMYGILRYEFLDPAGKFHPFGVSPVFEELIRQMKKIPLTYDEEGKLYLAPKSRKPGQKAQPGNKTLTELIGHSPDELDSLVLATFGLARRRVRKLVGAFNN